MSTFWLVWYLGGVALSIYAILRANTVMANSRKWWCHDFASALFVGTCGFSVFPVLNYVTAIFLLAVANDCDESKE